MTTPALGEERPLLGLRKTGQPHNAMARGAAALCS
jgi:hypothetical protein